MSLSDPEILAAYNAFTAVLGDRQTAVDHALTQMTKDKIVKRIWAKDHTVWQDDPTEIENRLGWLQIPHVMSDHVGAMLQLLDEVKSDGYSDVLLIGMGGSSLAPELFSKLFGRFGDGLNLFVLDSTDADMVNGYAAKLNPLTTLFIISTKSGGTVETLSGLKYFYNWTLNALGEEWAGDHFVAITDPGSKLETLATEADFRAIFLNEPTIGGRYSALSFFGLLPATLVGTDVATLLKYAFSAMDNCRLPEANLGLRLGAILGTMAKSGRDKLTFVSSPQLASFGDWVEQLVAESVGKDGKGILPVVGEDLAAPDLYGEDRLFVYLKLADEADELAEKIDALEAVGHPVLRFELSDLYEIGGQFFLWEFATAVASHLLGVQPFDQPNVEAAKVSARQMAAAYQQDGVLPAGEVSHYAELPAFLKQAETGDYVAIHAYITPMPESDDALNDLRLAIRAQTQLATTVGYAPRFLHSTGQLHKGDAGNGLFIQLTADAVVDQPIPNEIGGTASDMSFGVLKMAQALGDYQALKEAEPPRRVIRLHLAGNIPAEIEKLAALVSPQVDLL